MKRRLLSAGMLIAYGAILIKVMVFKDIPVIRIGALMLNFGGTQEGTANLIPFKTILPYLLGRYGLIIGGINLVGNIILLIPIGFLVPFTYRNITWKKTIALAVAAGFAIEGMQVLLQVGIFDIDDVILNALGVVIGYWAYTVLPMKTASKRSKRILISVLIVITVSVAFLGVYLYQKDKEPFHLRRGAEKGQPDRFVNGQSSGTQNSDPCNGTGGTGQIISVGKNSIMIKRRDGVNQIIKLTDQTMIRNSIGPISQSDLKTGVNVTLIIKSSPEKDGSMIASVVLVCNAIGPDAAK